MPGSLHRLLYIATAVPLLLVIIGIIMMLVDWTGHWLGWWQYGTGYALLLWGAALGRVAAVLAAAALIVMLIWHRRPAMIALSVVTIVAGVGIMTVPFVTTLSA